MTAAAPVVGILMGSDSDLKVMAECARVLEDYGIPYEAQVLSAHRTPEEAAGYARQARERGLKVLVAGAGGSAHLAGAMAAHSTLPVIGVPLEGSPLGGIDALLSTVQMPPGIPVAAVGVGAMGAKNAAHLAAAILAVADERIRKRVEEQRRRAADAVLKKSAGLPARLRALLDGR